ncbi:hypothetical protein LIER_29538 [Lithospermum erythrorhizon]|uniref:Thiol oxidase n=1 Tax=Lithospermum erythrorhizon TaxID=34254 RepID=A0AAV3RPN5_LITER
MEDFLGIRDGWASEVEGEEWLEVVVDVAIRDKHPSLHDFLIGVFLKSLYPCSKCTLRILPGIGRLRLPRWPYLPPPPPPREV